MDSASSPASVRLSQSGNFFALGATIVSYWIPASSLGVTEFVIHGVRTLAEHYLLRESGNSAYSLSQSGNSAEGNYGQPSLVLGYAMQKR
jgi:hypothetical protein